jgi:hypothetical protein
VGAKRLTRNDAVLPEVIAIFRTSRNVTAGNSDVKTCRVIVAAGIRRELRGFRVGAPCILQSVDPFPSLEGRQFLLRYVSFNDSTIGVPIYRYAQIVRSTDGPRYWLQPDRVSHPRSARANGLPPDVR